MNRAFRGWFGVVAVLAAIALGAGLSRLREPAGPEPAGPKAAGPEAAGPEPAGPSEETGRLPTAEPAPLPGWNLVPVVVGRGFEARPAPARGARLPATTPAPAPPPPPAPAAAPARRPPAAAGHGEAAGGARVSSARGPTQGRAAQLPAAPRSGANRAPAERPPRPAGVTPEMALLGRVPARVPAQDTARARQDTARARPVVPPAQAPARASAEAARATAETLRVRAETNQVQAPARPATRPATRPPARPPARRAIVPLADTLLADTLLADTVVADTLRRGMPRLVRIAALPPDTARGDSVPTDLVLLPCALQNPRPDGRVIVPPHNPRHRTVVGLPGRPGEAPRGVVIPPHDPREENRIVVEVVAMDSLLARTVRVPPHDPGSFNVVGRDTLSCLPGEAAGR